MVQFAPVKEEIIPNQVQGIVGNIYIWDITAKNVQFDVENGFVPANMFYSFTDENLLWTPNNSAFLSTFEAYKNFVTEKAIEFANQIPDGLLIGFEPGQPIENKIAWIRTDYARFLPKFYPFDKDTLTINDIKSEYCRYNIDTAEFLDCGVAENHELDAMKTSEVEIIFFPTILGFGPYLSCEHCMGWVVACTKGFFDDIYNLSIKPSTKELLESLEAQGVFYRKFKSFEKAKKFMEEEKAKTKWIVIPFKDGSRCLEVYEICSPYNQDLNPIDCGPFDSRTECESCEQRFYCDYDPQEDSSTCVLKTVAVGKEQNPEFIGSHSRAQCELQCSQRWYCTPDGDCEQLYPTGTTNVPRLDLPEGDTRYGYFLESRCKEECTKAWFCVQNEVVLRRFCDKLDKSDPRVEGLTAYNTIEECEDAEDCGNASTSSTSSYI